MKVILVYDIELKEPEDQRRLNRAKKIARKYLHHVQKSVFEGDITLSQLTKLQTEILKVIDYERDSVIIYKMPEAVQWERIILTKKEPRTGNII